MTSLPFYQGLFVFDTFPSLLYYYSILLLLKDVGQHVYIQMHLWKISFLGYLCYLWAVNWLSLAPPLS